MEAQDVIDRADALLADLKTLNAQLSARSRAIDNIAVAAGRAPTQAEIDEQTQLSNDRLAVIDAIQELAFLAMTGIDQSTTLAKLNDDLKDVNAELKGTLDRLKAAVGFTEAAAKVLAGLEEVAKGLVKLGIV